jgi:hypothetical protein
METTTTMAVRATGTAVSNRTLAENKKEASARPAKGEAATAESRPDQLHKSRGRHTALGRY